MTVVQNYVGKTVYAAAVFVVVYVGVCVGVGRADAQEQQELTFTVTPPLFQLNLAPGESWTSGIQVVNGNPYDITIYAEPVLFEPEGESGHPNFINVGVAEGGVDRGTVAGWITVPHGVKTVAREQTYVMPIAITVPEDAAPGGHYAAVLIGNRPPADGREAGAVSVTSSIASLIFLRVAGYIEEVGRIRDFVTERSLYEDAEARLSLRFENQGNVHLQPQGDITIYNMFNKKRGYIPVNHAKGYGNVLPNSIRKFTFTWKSDSGSWDIGRYRAEATLGYGYETKSFTHATVYFWVLPLVPLLQVAGSLVALVWFLGWVLRAYVRRALALESQRIGGVPAPEVDAVPDAVSTKAEVKKEVAENKTQSQPALRLGTLMRPLEEGMVDLRRARTAQQADPGSVHGDTSGESSLHIGAFVRRYRMVLVFVVVCVLGWIAIRAFVADVTTFERNYEAVEERPDGTRIELSEGR